MMLTEPVGPTSARLLKFLKKEGVLETFIRQCKDVNSFIAHVNGDRDKRWGLDVGGFAWGGSSEGGSFWSRIHGKWRSIR